MTIHYYVQMQSGAANNQLAGQFLQGPRTPERVRRCGYGFTSDLADAWPFDTAADAAEKGAIVDSHIGWEPRLAAVSF